MSTPSQRKPDALARGAVTICLEAKRHRGKRACEARWWPRVLAILLSFAMVCQAAAPPSVEYRVKAVALLNFTRFTDWPAASFTNSTAPLIIGIRGDDPFGDALAEAIAGESVHGHPLQIRSVTSDEGSVGCHLLFISRSETEKLDSIRKALSGKPILTVSEIDGFRDSGGMIQFVLHENRVRFDINRAAATQAGLTFSSRLLGVARSVTGK